MVKEIEDRSEKLERIATLIAVCRKCPLHRCRRNAVPGEGSPVSEVLFVGEAPGRQEDIQGRPFVGPAGKLLTELIKSIGLEREDVFITNLVKCRPPNNRDPLPMEIDTCTSNYLLDQLKIIRPRIVVSLGRHSTRFFLSQMGRPFKSILRTRGKIYTGAIEGVEIKLLPTIHPAAALYDPALKDLLDEDFGKLSALLRKSSKDRVTLEDYFS